MQGGDASRPPLSLEQQAELVDYFARRCEMHDGTVARESFVRIDADEAQDLRHLALRLRRMAPHEDEIKRLVVGR